jgi:ribosomal protein L28
MKCEICNKNSKVHTTTSELRNHLNPTGKKRSQPNLQKIRVPEDLSTLPKNMDPNLKGQKVKACTDCIKAIFAQAR